MATSATSSRDELPPLLRAAADGDEDALRAALAAGGELGARGAWFGSSALHLAAHGGHVSCVAALLDAGAEKDCKNDAGKRPFDYAREGGHAAVVELLAAAPSVKAQEAAKEAAQAAEEARAAAEARVAEAGRRGRAQASDRLLAACRAGDVAGVRAALAGGADRDAADRFGHTALILAAAKGATECCQALLGAGADTGVRNAMGQTAAEAAAQRGFGKLAEVLSTAGGDGA
jgi:ankyrin repeat protein